MILIVVFDGLRPDQIDAANTPNILGLAGRGVRFLNHHSTFPTHTRVNVASLVTGRYPSGHGIVSNSMLLPEVDPTWEVDTGDHLDMLRLDEMLDGRLMTSKTLGEVLHEDGKRMAVVGVGSSGNTFLHNHRMAGTGGPMVHPDFTIPEVLGDELDRRFGPWPDKSTPNGPRMERAVTVLLDHLIPTYLPEVAGIWFSEPDSSQHSTSIASEEAVQGIRQADAQLGRIVRHLEDTGLDGETDVLVLSDHGHSTVGQVVDVAKLLVGHGLKASEASTDVLVANNGGCTSIYVPDGGQEAVDTIVELLMRQPWCGPIFTGNVSPAIPGTFSLDLVSALHQRSPEILVSFNWTSDRNAAGIAGTAPSSGSLDVGNGNHGSISPFEVHNVLVAGGPHFKRGEASLVPSGNVDVFPTLLHIIGLSQPGPVDGRVLREALLGGPHPEEVFADAQVHETSGHAGMAPYRQQLQVSRVAETIYPDKGRAWVG